jgi:hypothetical protein
VGPGIFARFGLHALKFRLILTENHGKTKTIKKRGMIVPLFSIYSLFNLYLSAKEEIDVSRPVGQDCGVYYFSTAGAFPSVKGSNKIIISF